MQIDLTQMKIQESGTVSQLNGGEHFASKVQNMGIRPGKKITKVSSQFMEGPQTVKMGNLHVAIGYGMAKKIIVDVERDEIKSDK